MPGPSTHSETAHGHGRLRIRVRWARVPNWDFGTDTLTRRTRTTCVPQCACSQADWTGSPRHARREDTQMRRAGASLLFVISLNGAVMHNFPASLVLKAPGVGNLAHRAISLQLAAGESGDGGRATGGRSSPWRVEARAATTSQWRRGKAPRIRSPSLVEQEARPQTARSAARGGPGQPNAAARSVAILAPVRPVPAATGPETETQRLHGPETGRGGAKRARGGDETNRVQPHPRVGAVVGARALKATSMRVLAAAMRPKSPI